MKPSPENCQLLSEYYSRHYAEVRSFIAKRTGCDDVADDLTQDVFERLLNFGSMITAITLPSLVYTIARNKVCDFWRHRRSVCEYEHIVANGVSAGTSRQSDSPESVYSVNEILSQLEQGMSQLSAPQRIVYQMNLLEGMRVSEISKALGMKYKSVEHRLGDARKFVRNYIYNVRKDIV